MKTLLALLISCLTLSAATTYPVLTDSTNRLFLGGVTNVFFLNSNIVTTGTMRATGALTLTNVGNVFAGDGSGLTGVTGGVPTSGGSATNLSLYSSGTTNQPLRVIGGTQTNSNPVSIETTWNNSAVSFDAFNVSVTSSASGSSSTLSKWTADGSTYMKLSKSGRLEVGIGGAGLICDGVGNTVIGSLLWLNGASFRLENSTDLGWSSVGLFGAVDIAARRASAGLLELNSGTAGALRDLAARSLYATNLYATNLIINGGATVTKILSATATLNFDLTALTVEDLTITVTGAADGDVVTLGVPNGSVTTSVQYSAWVSAADTVTVRARTSATGENPASGTFRATIFKH